MQDQDIDYTQPKTIQTVGALLEELQRRGMEEIAPFLDIGHNPTIGDMYEGLTKELMNEAIFEQMDLRVASGKIKNSSTGEMSKQIDCMIVIGDGTPIPYTSDYIYDINSVVMVIEVKKNLYSKELSDAYENLKSVVNIQKDDFRSIRMNMIEDAFRMLVGKPCPKYENAKELSYEEEMLFHSLIVEALLPIRVIFGYYGFQSEVSLREKYVEYLSTKMSEGSKNYQKGYGITSLPNLVVCGANSIIKTNGMPYTIKMDCIEDEYCWLASYRRKPMILLLELLWTRLTYHYNLSTDVFGNGISEEALAPYITTNIVKDMGWKYRVIPYKQTDLNSIDQMEEKAWTPTVLDDTEYVIMNSLCNDVDIKADDTHYFADAEEAKRIIKHLKESFLVYIDDDNYLRLLTKQCRCATVPGIGFVAADDNDGRFSDWMIGVMLQRKRSDCSNSNKQ